jgi:hypothetical protein
MGWMRSAKTEVSITWAFPMMDRLMGSVESFKRTGLWGYKAVQQSLQLSWETLRKYYRHMNQSVYYVCLFLDPQVKTSYVEHNWEPDWLPAAEDALQRAWDRYKHIQLPPPSDACPPPDDVRRDHVGRLLDNNAYTLLRAGRGLPPEVPNLLDNKEVFFVRVRHSGFSTARGG